MQKLCVAQNRVNDNGNIDYLHKKSFEILSELDNYATIIIVGIY